MNNPLTPDQQEALRIAINTATKVYDEHINSFREKASSNVEFKPIFEYFMGLKVNLCEAALTLDIYKKNQKTMHS